MSASARAKLIFGQVVRFVCVRVPREIINQVNVYNQVGVIDMATESEMIDRVMPLK